MEMDDQSFYAGDMPIRFLCPVLIRDRRHLVRDTDAENEADIAI